MPRLRESSEVCSRPWRAAARVLSMVVLGVGVVGCTGAPTVVREGDPMALGDFELRVVGVSTSEADRTAPSEYEGKYVIEVSLSCDGHNRFDRLDLKDELFDTDSIRIIDESGRRGQLLGVNSDAGYGSFAFRFFSHEESGLRLLIRNVARKADQPRSYEVALG